MVNVKNPISAMQAESVADRLFYLDALRAVAIFFVVWHHAIPYAHDENVLTSQAHFFLQLIDPGVAFFFLADGFLFARHLNRQPSFQYGDYLRKSAWRLLLPWLLFTTAYCLLRAIFEYAGLFTSYLLIGRPLNDILILFFFKSFQMYFLMSLFFIRALSPFTRHLAVKDGGRKALFATVLYILLLNTSSFELGSDSVTSAVAGLQYYLLGILYFHLDVVLRRLAMPIALACLLGYGIMVALEVRGLVPESAKIVAKLAAMTANYALYLSLIRCKGLLVRLGQHTMQVYLLHSPVLLFGVALVLKRVVAGPLALHLGITVVTFFGALAVGLLIYRIPKGRIVFGERV